MKHTAPDSFLNFPNQPEYHRMEINTWDHESKFIIRTQMFCRYDMKNVLMSCIHQNECYHGNNMKTRASSEEATHARGLVILNYINMESIAHL